MTVQEIKDKVTGKMLRGDISATFEDSAWLITMIDTAYILGRSAERREINQTIKEVVNESD